MPSEAPPPPPSKYPPYPPYRRSERPLGVSILAVLSGIGGALAVLAGVFMIALSGFVVSLRIEDIPRSLLEDMPIPPPILKSFLSIAGIIFVALGVFMLILAALGFLLAWGLWTGKSWAWALTIVLQALGALMSTASLIQAPPSGIVGLAISVFIIYYMTRPHVKAYFGRL